MSDPRALDERDDRPHEHGGEEGWRESLTFVLSDPALIMVVRAGWDPQARRAMADVLMRLEDGVLVRAAFRADGVVTRETEIGDLRFSCEQRLREWSIHCKTLALMATSDTVLVGAVGRTQAPPAMGQARTLSFDLVITALGDADGSATRRRVITDQRFASIVSSGHFDQAVMATGAIEIGDRRLKAEMVGVRSRTWGVREPDPGDARLLVGFDPGHAVWHERLVLSDASIQHTGLRGEGSLPERLQVTDAEGQPARLVLGGLSAQVLAALAAEPDEPRQRLVVLASLGDHEALGYAELAVADA